jgi:transposase-like protein
LVEEIVRLPIINRRSDLMTKPTKQTKKHTSEFKCKVALESFVKDDVAGVARKHGIRKCIRTSYRPGEKI